MPALADIVARQGRPDRPDWMSDEALAAHESAEARAVFDYAMQTRADWGVRLDYEYPAIRPA